MMEVQREGWAPAWAEVKRERGGVLVCGRLMRAVNGQGEMAAPLSVPGPAREH